MDIITLRVKKVAKVKWELYCLSTELGGLGILNIEDLADRLATKWILRGLMLPDKNWVWLLNMKNHMFALKGHHRWKKIPYLTIFGSKYEITPK